MDTLLMEPTLIGKRIEAVLREQGKKVSWLAQQSGAERSTVHRIIKGQRKNPKPETLREFADAFGMPVEQLVAGTDAAARVKEASHLIPRAHYEEAIAKMLMYEQNAREADDRARRASEEGLRERDRRVRTETETETNARHQAETIERLRRERDQARDLAEHGRQDADRYRDAFKRAAAEIVELRAKIIELGEAIDDGHRTGRVAAILAGTAAAASVLTYLSTRND